MCSAPKIKLPKMQDMGSVRQQQVRQEPVKQTAPIFDYSRSRSTQPQTTQQAMPQMSSLPPIDLMSMQIPSQPAVSKLAELQRKFADQPEVPELKAVAPPTSVAAAEPPQITTSKTKKARQRNRSKGVRNLRIPLAQKIGGGKATTSATGVNIAR